MKPEDTQRSSNATRSDEKTSPSVQPPAPEPVAWRLKKSDRWIYGEWLPGVNYHRGIEPLYASPSIAQRGAALTAARRVVHEWEYGTVVGSGDVDVLSPELDIALQDLAAALALSPERPEPPAPSTTGEKP